MKYFWLILYYGLAKHLPKSTAPIIGGIPIPYFNPSNHALVDSLIPAASPPLKYSKTSS